MVFDFHKDLSFGEDFEYRMIQKLKPKHNFRKEKVGYFKPYDLICDDCGLTAECKTDRYRTGNMVFETDLLNKSTADIVLYEVMDKIYWAKLNELKYWLRLDIKVNDLKPIPMGDSNNKGYLIPIKDTIMYMEVL